MDSKPCVCVCGIVFAMLFNRFWEVFWLYFGGCWQQTACIFRIIIFNICLFFILLIGIQNSSNKSKVNFLINETVKLPISFIIGTSFIGGSLIGNLFTINLRNKNE